MNVDKNELIKRSDPIVDNIPQELKSKKQWVLWKLEKNDKEKLVKVPYNPRTNARTDPTKPIGLESFKRSIQTFKKDPSYFGIGFTPLKKNGITIIDLDHSREVETQKPVSTEISDIINKFNSYTEVSPSGTGYRIIVKGNLKEKGNKTGNYEIYDSKHYFTITGNRLNGSSSKIVKRQPIINWFHSTYIKSTKVPESSSEQIKVTSFEDRLILEIENGKHGEDIRNLWSGKWEGKYSSQSEGDITLCSFLSKILGKRPKKIDSIFRRSKLFRKKWDEKHGEKTYGEMTIDKILETFLSVYPFEKFLLNADNFLKLDIPAKDLILDPWLYERQIVLVPGYRGIGKTWFGISLLDTICRGLELGPRKTKKPVPCLYIDGEMGASDLKDRILLLGNWKKEQKCPLIIYSDDYANSLGIPRASFSNQRWLNDLEMFLIDEGIKIVAFDNISSLSPGIEENSKKEWDPINQWLIELRFSGITSILFHHLNKLGGQRGTSGREDNIDTTIMLIRPTDYVAGQGVRFMTEFTKIRTKADETSFQNLEFKLREDYSNNSYRVKWDFAAHRVKVAVQILQYLNDGVLSQKEIAEVVRKSRGYISQVRAKAIADK